MDKKKKATGPELIPCPICGASAYVQRDITGKKRYHACCNGWSAKFKCPLYAGITPWSDTEEEAARIWNSQKEPQAV